MFNRLRYKIAAALLPKPEDLKSEAGRLAAQLNAELNGATNKELLASALQSSATVTRELVVAAAAGAAAGIAVASGAGLALTIGVGVGTAVTGEAVNVLATPEGKVLISRAITPKTPDSPSHGVPTEYKLNLGDTGGVCQHID